MSQVHVLVVDDDPALREILQETLMRESYSVSTAEDGAGAVQAVKETVVHIVITDFQLPDIDGLEVIDRLSKLDAKIIPIVMTGFGTIETAVRAMKSGAFDFITKPFDLGTVAAVVRRAAEFHRLRQENHLLRRAVRDQYRLEQLVGVSEPMQQVLEFVQKVADSDSTVMIQGESGTGKELVARMLHFNSQRRDRPLVPVNCGAIPENLLESELFGHEKGAFTGATHARMGRFELAHGGTIFLDEIGEIDQATQVKLLRVLSERTIERVGSNQPIKVDVRVITASNKNLRELVSKGEFREDLFFRLNVVRILMPTLREREEDIVLLAQAFLREFSSENNKELKPLSDDALALLRSYPWPGNVRELRTAIEHGVVMSNVKVINSQHLPYFLKSPEPVQTPKKSESAETLEQNQPNEEIPLASEEEFNLHVLEIQTIRRALQHTHDNRTDAARLLGISRRTLQRKLKELGSNI
jgi:DNA-binding NtrC family response regulator